MKFLFDLWCQWFHKESHYECLIVFNQYGRCIAMRCRKCHREWGE